MEFDILALTGLEMFYDVVEDRFGPKADAGWLRIYPVISSQTEPASGGYLRTFTRPGII